MKAEKPFDEMTVRIHQVVHCLFVGFLETILSRHCNRIAVVVDLNVHNISEYNLQLLGRKITNTSHAIRNVSRFLSMLSVGL